MKIGLYSKLDRNILTSFADGVLALGLSPVWRNPSVFTPDQKEPFDMIALWGGAGQRSREIINTYDKFDIKTLVFEGGYVGQDTHTIGIGGHYWLPDFDCPDDRIYKFGLKFEKNQKKDGYILVLGQSEEINSGLVKIIEGLNTDRKVIFRPHPSIPFKSDKIEILEGSFSDALNGAHCVICHTSNGANRALLKGIPVFCSPNNMASDVSNTDFSAIESPYFPDDKELKDYFSRLCYAVWDESEIKDGTALKFYLSVLKNDVQFKKTEPKSVKKLRGKFKGQTAYIIGKGPSLKYLSKTHFNEGVGVVVPLNEAVKIAENIDLAPSLSIFSQQKDGKPECMVKPKKAPLLLSEKESKGWFESHERYIFDLQKDYSLKNNGVSVLGGNCCSVIAAIEFVKMVGCNKIVFLCFDGVVGGSTDYPEDSRLGKLFEEENRIEHIKSMKQQIDLHTDGLECEFIIPEVAPEPFTVITLTGDRPDAFKLCKKYLERQTVQPEQWIVVDDGKRALPKKDRVGCEYYRRKALKGEPDHTLRLNLLEALKHVKHGRIVIVEDDDWYREDYLEIQLKHLETSDLVGQNTFFYWNLKEKSFHKVKETSRPAMCLTAFKLKVCKTLIEICKNDPKIITSENERKKIDAGSVDLSLWTRYEGKKEAYNEGENLCVGIKGVSGRKGHTLGHAKAHTDYFESDPKAKMLKRLIGEDIKNYGV